MGIWRDLFGVGQRESWSALAEQIGGAFRDASWGSTAQVHARLGGYDLVLDTYVVSSGNSSTTYTRLRVPFVNARGLRMSLARASFFTPLAKLFGQRDLLVGEPAFDKDFVIDGNNEERVRQVLSDPGLRALIVAQPHVRLEIVDDEGLFGPKYGPGVDVLRFTEAGVIKDVARLTGLFSLLAGMLHAVRDGAQHFLEVPAAELPASFQAMFNSVCESLGGQSERVGDTFEARLPDPLGLVDGARIVLTIPTLPLLETSIRLEAALPLGSVGFVAEKRGLLALGVIATDDPVVDEHLAVRGDQAQVARVLRPLALLAPFAPRIEAEAERLSVVVDALAADRAPLVLGAALDLWLELCRVRAGL